ncbi:28S ribosomal protein S33, mitochondrial [Frankliniella fusca]|uniref:Small ribosomal subunit protein mS33 n=1 Tax=Frankliniella fusca TaxID=407009 RepID=A0AAE1LR66_9NEOP|nr:28S ribosomal protein S33, mitochondrial [Frankliniella fusca]
MATVKKYLQLAETGTVYAQKMNLLSNRIFGEVTRPTSFHMLKIADRLSVLPVHKDPDTIDYYHRLPESYYLFVFLRNYGLFRDEHADFKDEMKRLRKLRGKIREVSWFKPNPDRPTKFASLKLK